MLPADIHRCAGRRDMSADSPVCEWRTRCDRHVSLIQQLTGSSELSPVSLWMCADSAYKNRIPVAQTKG